MLVQDGRWMLDDEQFRTSFDLESVLATMTSNYLHVPLISVRVLTATATHISNVSAVG